MTHTRGAHPSQLSLNLEWCKVVVWADAFFVTSHREDFMLMLIITLSAILASIIYTHTHPFNGPLTGTTQVSWYQKGNTNLDFTEARDSEWQWHQLGRMQVCTSLQTDNHTNTSPLSFLQAGCPSCRPTNSVKALKAIIRLTLHNI